MGRTILEVISEGVDDITLYCDHDNGLYGWECTNGDEEAGFRSEKALRKDVKKFLVWLIEAQELDGGRDC